MSRHERPDDRDESLIDGALDEESRRADDDVAEHVPPSFAAIVARAHRIDPRAIGADDVERAARVTRTPRTRAPEPIADDELAPMIATLRAEAERDIAKRERVGPPPCGLLDRLDVQRRNARARQWIAGFSAVAAAAAVVLGLDWLERWNARRTFDEHEATQSVSAVQGGAVPLTTVVPAETLPVVPPKPQRIAPVPVPEVAPPATLPSEPAPLELSADPSTGLASPRPRAVSRDAVGKVPADAALRKLDALAQDALARGERSEADELYAKVIAKGRKHPLVEIAYAERFSLARGGGSAAQRELWNGYLAAFPDGRFADDAHAGLCRTASADDKATCWQGYVDRFPAGAYRRHAEEWLVSATP